MLPKLSLVAENRRVMHYSSTRRNLKCKEHERSIVLDRSKPAPKIATQTSPPKFSHFLEKTVGMLGVDESLHWQAISALCRNSKFEKKHVQK